MQNLLFFLGVCTFAVAAADIQCSADTKTLEAAKESRSALIDFASQLYGNITQLKPNENIIFSPVSIALALALVEGGANGPTRDEIQKFLKRADSNSQIAAVYKSLQHHLRINETKLQLSIANGLWTAPSFTIKPDYKMLVEQCFEAKLEKANFQGDLENSRKKINQFVSDATNAKIPELWKEGVLTRDVAAVLVNALYFKGSWRNTFAPELTQEGPFYTQGRDTPKQVQFMQDSRDVGYVSQGQFDAIKLQYFGEDVFAMYIILPKARNGLEDVVKLVDSSVLNTLVNGQEQRIKIKIPKFTIRTSLDLKAVLSGMGMTTMFTMGANFSRMTDADIYVSKAVHEAFITIHENGTEAAASAGFAFTDRSPGPSVVDKEFIADHPFLYYIVHKPTGAPIFMGKVVDVVNEE